MHHHLILLVSTVLLLCGVTVCTVLFPQIRAAGELSGHAAAADQEEHEEAEGGAQ